MRLIKKIWKKFSPIRYMFGRDIFISYSRSDTFDYSEKLGLALQKRILEKDPESFEKKNTRQRTRLRNNRSSEKRTRLRNNRSRKSRLRKDNRNNYRLKKAGKPEEVKTKIKKLSFYLDKYEVPTDGKDGKLPRLLKRHLRWSSSLAIICTPEAVKSKWVQREIAYFSSYGGKVILIDVANTLQKVNSKESPWKEIHYAFPTAVKERKITENPRPSDKILDRIIQLVKFTTQDKRLKRSVFTAAFVSLALIGSAYIYTSVSVANADDKVAKAEENAKKITEDANKKVRVAKQAVSVAEGKEIDANQKAVDATNLAKEKTKEAVKANNLAEDKTREADFETQRASDQEQIADSEKKRAENETAKAVEAREQKELAENEARRQGEIAEEKRIEAERQGKISASRQLIAAAEQARYQGKNIFINPTSFAVKAWEKYPSYEPNSLLQYGLSHLPRPIDSSWIKHEGKVEKMIFTSGGRILTTLSDDQKVHEWNIETQTENEPLDFGPDARISVLSDNGKVLAVVNKSNENIVNIFQLNDLNKPTIKVIKHDSKVVKVTINTDTEIIVTADADKIVKCSKIRDQIWNQDKGEFENIPVEVLELSSFSVSTAGEIENIAISRNGETVAITTLSSDTENDVAERKITVWKTETGKKTPLTGEGTNANLSPDGKYLGYIDPDEKTAVIEGFDDGDEKRSVRLQEFGDINFIKFMGKSSIFEWEVATGNTDGKVNYYWGYISNGGQLEKIKPEPIQLEAEAKRVHLKEKGEKVMIIQTKDNTFHAFSSREPLKPKSRIFETMRIPNVVDFAFGEDESTFVTLDEENNIFLWKKTTNGATAESNLVHSTSDKYVMMKDSDEIIVWDVKNVSPINSIKTTDFPTSVSNIEAISEDASVLLTTEFDGNVKILNNFGRDEFTPDSRRGKLLGVSLKNGVIATRGSDNLIHFWSNYGQQYLRSVTETQKIDGVLFSPNGEHYYLKEKGQPRLIKDSITGKEMPNFSSLVGNILTFSPNSRFYVSNETDNSVQIREIASGKQFGSDLKHSCNVKEVSFNLKGNILLTQCENNDVLLWTINGKKIKTIKNNFPVGAKFWSNNSKYLSTVTEKGLMRVFDGKSGRQIGIDFKFETPIINVAFTPDENFLAVATSSESSEKKSVFVYEISTSTEVLQIGFDGSISNVGFNPRNQLLTVIMGGQILQIPWLSEDLVEEARFRLLRFSNYLN